MSDEAGRKFAAAAGLALTALGFGACSSMSSIDRDVDRLVNEYSALIDGGAAPPRRREFLRAEEYESDTQWEKRPETVNPAPGELMYTVAPSDRDVIERLSGYTAIPEDARNVSLSDAFRIAQESAREYKTAEEEYILSAIRLLIERRLWGPRFFDDLSARLDGSFDRDNPVALSLINELRVTQRLPYGGQVEASLLTEATQQLRDSVSEGYEQSTALVLRGDIPLLRDAGLVAREDLIQAERNLVYAAREFEDFRRQFFVDIATDYFDLAARRAAIANQQRSLDGRRQSLERALARVEGGKDPASSARSFEQDILEGQDALIGAQEAYTLALDRFKIRLGIPVETPIDIEPVRLELYDPDTTPAEAARTALLFRLDLQNERDRIDDARRDIAIARNQLLPDLDLSGFVSSDTLTTFDDVGGLGLDFQRSDYQLGVTFGLPLDREIERLNLRASVIGLQRSIREYERFRDNVILEARASRRQIEQARVSLQLAQQGVEASQLRLEELILREAEALDIRDAQDALLRAENQRDEAIRRLRVSILEYLRTTGTLRIQPTGEFQPLPGMPGEASQSAPGPGEQPPREPPVEAPAEPPPAL